MFPQTIETFLERSDDLELFPAAAIRIREIVEREDTSFIDLEQAVAMDPTLSAQILRLANSPFYGMRRSVSSLLQALLVLGFNATRQLALALSLMSLGRSERKLSRELWSHSIRTAICAQLIASSVGQRSSEAFLTGMVHDLGKFVFLELDRARYGPILKDHFHDNEALLEAEKSIYSFDHAAFAGACLERWELPDHICAAVRFHHAVATMDRSALDSAYIPATIIWIADQMEHGLKKNEPIDLVADRIRKTNQATTIGVTTDSLISIAEDLDKNVKGLDLPNT